MCRLALRFFVVLLPLLAVASCGGDSPGTPDPGPPPLAFETREGVLELPAGSALAAEDLVVTSFAGQADVGADGAFSVRSCVATKHQLLFFRDRTSGRPVMIGVYDPALGTVQADVHSTADAMVLLNPYLVYATQPQRAQYLAAARLTNSYDLLLDKLNAAWAADPTSALDYDADPTLFQAAVQAMREAMESLGGAGAPGLKRIGIDRSPPTIEDRDGADVAFINPRHCNYAAGVYPVPGDLDHVLTVNRRETIVSLQLWPPDFTTDPEETLHALGDGLFKIFVTREIDYGKFTEWDDPVGRATITNTAQVALYIIELVVGEVPWPNIVTLPRYIHIDVADVAIFAKATNEGDVIGYLTQFCKLLVANAEGFAYWIWQEYNDGAAHLFISQAANILSKVTLVFELLGAANDEGPFFWDLLLADREVTYTIRQTNGVIVSNEVNAPPTAAFTIFPPAGIVETVFAMDAAASADDHDEHAELQFRWDWDSDGVWDTGWSSADEATHSWSETGSYTVTLAVMDTGGLSGTASHVVNVGGGAGTADHVKIFQDQLPWNTNALVQNVQALGFTPGTGPDTYEIFSSAQMATTPLVPGEDLVIIANDQAQLFYNNYAASQVRFTNFVHGGGALLWEACDEGWANGSLAAAGVMLPGNLTTQVDFDYTNFVANQALPVVAGLPASMDHNFASHEALLNLPDGATVYCVNEEGEPTLVEFNLGSGWCVVTGQPLEHQFTYIYGASDMEHLLPRLVSYFTGRMAAKGLPAPVRTLRTGPDSRGR